MKWLIIALLAILVALPINKALAMNVTLAWDANSEPDLAGYRVYWGAQAGGPYETFEDVSINDPGFDKTSPEYTVSGLDGSVRVYFVVTAYDLEGLESGYSNEVWASDTWDTPGVPPAPPGGCFVKALGK